MRPAGTVDEHPNLLLAWHSLQQYVGTPFQLNAGIVFCFAAGLTEQVHRAAMLSPGEPRVVLILGDIEIKVFPRRKNPDDLLQDIDGALFSERLVAFLFSASLHVNMQRRRTRLLPWKFLRFEMNSKLGSIEEKLAVLLEAKKKQ